MRKNIFRGLIAASLGLAMAVGVGVGIVGMNKRATALHADLGNRIYNSGTPSFGSSYAADAKTINGVSWYFSTCGNNTCMGWNNSSQDHTADATMGPLSNISQATKIGGYQNNSAQAFTNAQKITITVSNTDTVTGSWYIWYSTNSGSSWTQAISSSLTSSTAAFSYDHGSKIGDSVMFAFGFGTTKTTKTRISISGIEIWEEAEGGGLDPTTFTISFDGNGASGGMDDVTNVEPGNYTLPANGFNVPSGKLFIGWKANNSGDLIPAGNSYNVTANVTFYAQWANTYSVTYNANGGTGTVTDSNSPYVSGATVTVKSGDGLTAAYPDEVFDKWNTAANGSGTNYAPGATFDISTNTTLYAQWKDDPSIPYVSSYSSGFETSENFTADTSYNTTKDEGPSGKQWHVYYGTTSTDSCITGSQSLQMRWYSSAKTNYPYAQTSFASIEVKRISFKYKVSNANLDFKVQYNTDGGNTWTDIETINTSDTTDHAYKKIFDTSIPSFYFRVLVCLGTAPSSGNYKFTIDDVKFDSIATPATINGSDTGEVGTQWSPTNITENVGGAVVTGVTYSFVASNGATISSSNTSTGAFTCSSAGTVVVNATKSGYLITGKTVTVQPADAYVNELSKTSTSGYTGQTDTISFSYGNLNGTLNAVSNDPSVVTVDDPAYSTGSGTVTLNFVGAGSTTVIFKDGSTTIEGATITVTVTTSSVSISGMPSSKTMGNGTSLDLAAYITVNATGICSDDVTWSSSQPSVADVNGSGVVTASAVGSTIITVTPEDYPAGAVSCTVSVINEKAILAESIAAGDVVVLGSRAPSTQYNGPSSTSTVYGLGVSYVDAPNIDTFALEVEAGSADNSFAFRIISGDYEDKYLAWLDGKNSLNVSDEINDNSSWNVVIDGEGNASITNVNTTSRKIWWNVDSPRFACYENKSDGDDYKYVQLWKTYKPDNYLNLSSTIQTIHGHENYSAEVLTSVDSVAIRFGATVSKDNWDAIEANWSITDYGVMLMKAADLDASEYISVADAFSNAASSSILKIINKRAGGAEYTDPYLNGDEYLFTVKVSFPDNSTYYDDRIYAAPFVVIGGQYYFFDEMNVTVRELAYNYIGSGYEYLSDAALEHIFDAN